MLVQGADVWLNNPQRPLEACGTSGMKASANGALNMSILDGWWAEGYHPDNGWAIGGGEEYKDQEYQDDVESRAIYNLFEREAVPLFYDRGEDRIPRGWVAKMKASMHTICPVYNSNRMLVEYVNTCYKPCHVHSSGLIRKDFSGAKDLAFWRRNIQVGWSEVSVESITSGTPSTILSGTPIEVTICVKLGELSPQDVMVELYYGHLSGSGEFEERETIRARHVKFNPESKCHEYQAALDTKITGTMGVTARIMPYHSLMGNRYALGLAIWGS